MPARRVILAGGGLACLAAVSACQGSVSIGAKAVPKTSVEHQIATTLAARVNQPVPSVVCPGDLAAKVGTTMTCQLTPQHSTEVDPVDITVNSVTNGVAHFAISVDAPTASPAP